MERCTWLHHVNDVGPVTEEEHVVLAGNSIAFTVLSIAVGSTQ